MQHNVTPQMFNAGGPLDLIEQAPRVRELTINKGRLFLQGILTPTQIAANQNDYNPSGLATAHVLRLSTDASRNITGLAGGVPGRAVLLFNVGSFNIVLKDADASSVAANRFALNGDVTLVADEGIWIWYDGTTERWRVGSQKTVTDHDSLSGVSANDHHNQSHPTSDHSWELDKYKTAAETVNNSATLQNDDHLAFAIGANEQWAFEMFLAITSTTTADFRLSFTVPSGATIQIGGDISRNATSGAHLDGAWLTGDGTTNINMNADVVNALRLSGVVINGANAGTVQLQWAQGGAAAVDTIVQAGSWLKAKRLV